MGTKRRLSARVAELASTCQDGPFLDLFAGMCSVASAIGTGRQIWLNDAQVFAHEVAKAYFCEAPADSSGIEHAHFDAQKSKLSAAYAADLELEQIALSLGDVQALAPLALASPKPDCRGYDLFSCTYAGTYFGIHQLT